MVRRRQKNFTTSAERAEVSVEWGRRKERLLLALSAEEKLMLRVLSERSKVPMSVVIRRLVHDAYEKHQTEVALLNKGKRRFTS